MATMLVMAESFSLCFTNCIVCACVCVCACVRVCVCVYIYIYIYTFFFFAVSLHHVSLHTLFDNMNIFFFSKHLPGIVALNSLI
jgi:hypothetical protein